MFQSTNAFRCIHRPEGVAGSYLHIVVDVGGNPHLPLTRFYNKVNQWLSQGTARAYLNSLLPFFTYITTDEWRKQRGDQWDSPPEAIQQCVRDYLMYRLGCQVRPKETYALVFLTAQSPNTVHIFLAALKLFYTIMLLEERYAYSHPLLDASTRLLREIEREEGMRQHRMPQISGIEEPDLPYPSENIFRLNKEEWTVQPVEDPQLGRKLIHGFAQANFCLRDQIVVRMALETGARIREILRLTVGDWRALGCNQEVRALSKGSRGRRVKKLRFSSTTARMLRQYLNTDRAVLDREGRRLDHLDDVDPLFLSQRHHPYDYEAFKPHWKKLCQAAQVPLNIHGMRHWYTTQAIRIIALTAQNEAEIVLRKEELVRYMAWRSPETLKTYEKYFQGKQHYMIQDSVHQSLEEDVATYLNKQEDSPPLSKRKQRQPALPSHDLSSRSLSSDENKPPQKLVGWANLLALGGTQEYGRKQEGREEHTTI
jgi:hypothetical protein